VNADRVDNDVISNINFQLDLVSFINFVTVEAASTYERDFEIVLRSPDSDEYVLMNRTDAVGGIVGSDLGAFDMGEVPGDASLSNVAPYVFMSSSGFPGFTAPYSSPGTYNVEEWGSGPHA
jgi:hypothetical protein